MTDDIRDIADFIRAHRAGETAPAPEGLRAALEDGEVLGLLASELGVTEDEMQEIAEDLHAACTGSGAVLRSDVSHGTVIVRDAAGGVWHPSDEALAEIQQAADPAARAIEIAEREPMRGTWHD